MVALRDFMLGLALGLPAFCRADRSGFCANTGQYDGTAPSNYGGYTCDGFLAADAKMNAVDWSSPSAVQAACDNPEEYDGTTRRIVMTSLAGGAQPCCRDGISVCTVETTKKSESSTVGRRAPGTSTWLSLVGLAWLFRC